MALGSENRDDGAVFTVELTYSIVVSVALTLVTVIFKDHLTPFYSFVFVIGTAAVFFLANTFGSAYGIQHGAALLALMFWVNLVKEDGVSVFAFQAPFLALFFIMLATIPNSRPNILAAAIRNLKKEVKAHEKKVEELNAVMKKEHKEQVAEKSSQSRQLAAKYSSRNTVLISFARGLLQAGSVREILNLLFYSLSKCFGAQQCAMFIRSQEANELIISRIIHADHQRLENSRCSLDLPYFQQVMNKKELVGFPGPTLVTEDVEAEVIFPVLLDGEIHAIFTLSHVKDGSITDEDRRFIETLSALTSNAADQLQVVMST